MSDMRRCEIGHVYDPGFYHRCPSCGIPGLAVGAAPEGTVVYGSPGAAAPAAPTAGGATVAMEEPTGPPNVELPKANAAPPPQAPRETPAFRADADPNATRIVGPPPTAKPTQPSPQAQQPPPEKAPAPPPQRTPAGGGATQLIEDPLMGGFADPRRQAREAKDASGTAASESQPAQSPASEARAEKPAVESPAAEPEQPLESRAAADQARSGSPDASADAPPAAAEGPAGAPRPESPTADLSLPEIGHTDVHAAEPPTADISAPAQPPQHARPPHAHTPAQSGTIAFWGDLPGSKPAGEAAAAAAARPVVGWLVAIAGPEKGKDYRLLPEGNPIGRAETNQVVIEDPGISQQEPHAILYYDPRSAEPTYYLQPGPRQMVYHNGKPIFTATTLEANDVLEMGGTKLLFVPLCTDRFRWSEDHPSGGGRGR